MKSVKKKENSSARHAFEGHCFTLGICGEEEVTGETFPKHR